MSQFSTQDIVTFFEPLIGYQQRENPKYKHLPASLVNDENFNSVNQELLSTENLLDTVANTVSYTRVVWDSGTTYNTGDYVDFAGVEYIALQTSTADQPDISPTFWEIVGDIIDQDTILSRLRQQAIKDMFKELFTMRANKDTRSVMESNTLYVNGGYKSNTGWNLADVKGFHGIALTPKALNHTLHINRIALQLTEAVAGLTLYVFTDSNETAIQTINVDYTTPYDVQWIDVDIKLPAFASNHASMPTFYIGAFDADLGTARFIKSDWSQGYYGWCGSCSWGRASRERQKTICRWVTADSMSWGTGDLDGVNLPQTLATQENGYMVFNIDFTVYQDPTHLVKKNANMFLEAIRYKGAVLLLNNMNSSHNLNRTANLTKDMILRALHGYDAENIKGIQDMYKYKLKEVDKNMKHSDDFGTSDAFLTQIF